MRSWKAFDEISGSARKRISEKSLGRLEILSSVIALVSAVLCLLFLLGPLQSFRVLAGVLVLGILLNLFLMLAGLLRKAWIVTGTALFLMFVYSAALVWFLK